jgi:hypothetical protein
MTDAPKRNIAKRPHSGPSREQKRPLSRRALIAGAVPVAAAATAAAGALAMQYSRTTQSPVIAVPADAASSPSVPTSTPPATPSAAATPRLEAAPRGTEEPTQAARILPNIGVPQGMALVASPRLPLPGVGPQDPWRLLTGTVPNWAEL